MTGFRPELNWGPADNPSLSSPVLFFTELWWQIHHRWSFRTLCLCSSNLCRFGFFFVHFFEFLLESNHHQSVKKSQDTRYNFNPMSFFVTRFWNQWRDGAAINEPEALQIDYILKSERSTDRDIYQFNYTFSHAYIDIQKFPQKIGVTPKLPSEVAQCL